MNRIVHLGIGIAAALVLLVSFACGGDDDEATVDGEPQTIALTLSDELVFDPPDITAEAGQPVTLEINNTSGTTLHDFSIESISVTAVAAENASEVEGHAGGHGSTEPPDFDLHIAVDAGETARLTFTPTEAGEYHSFCSVDGHRDAGMVGRLLVQ